MRHLLALLEDGTHGTPAEPASLASHAPQDIVLDHRLATPGTLGTLGTSKIEQLGADDTVAQRVGDLIDAWHERMALCLEAGDITEAEAEITAALEVGRAFVRKFVNEPIASAPREETTLD